jgi:hypothetical protein
MRLTTSYDLHHPVAMAWVRFVAGTWLVVLTVLLCSIGDWWALVLLLAAGLLFWVGGASCKATTSCAGMQHAGMANVFSSGLASLLLLRPASVASSDNDGWSLYGAPWLQPVATGRKSSRRGSCRNKPKPLLWVATSCRKQRMVRVVSIRPSSC